MCRLLNGSSDLNVSGAVSDDQLISDIGRVAKVAGTSVVAFRRPDSRSSRIASVHSYTYTVVMKNITLSIDENILATVRRHAAERNSTINALVREYLTGLAAHEDRAKRARARLRQLSAQSQGKLGKKTWTRENLHDR